MKWFTQRGFNGLAVLPQQKTTQLMGVGVRLTSGLGLLIGLLPRQSNGRAGQCGTAKNKSQSRRIHAASLTLRSALVSRKYGRFESWFSIKLRMVAGR